MSTSVNLIGSRTVNEQGTSLKYFGNDSLLRNRGIRSFIEIEENTCMVDGIGGTTWEGSMILLRMIEDYLSKHNITDLENITVLELGAGAGLVGLELARLGMKVVVTDRISDLAQKNLDSLKGLYPNLANCVEILDLEWIEGSNMALSNILQRHKIIDIVVGAEITCLRKQHPYLLRTIRDIVSHSPNVLMFFTFDGIQTDGNFCSNYEKEFVTLMKSINLNSLVLHNAQVCWESTKADNGVNELAYYTDYPNSTLHDFDFSSNTIKGFIPISGEREDIRGNLYHHVILFHCPVLINTCSRCHNQFLNSYFLNTDSSCWHHTGYYVCRRHPAELRCSINGKGDCLGYYGNGVEGWPAEFWDCCGSEDIGNAGCKHSCHVPYCI